jgi:hypothetical protein
VAAPEATVPAFALVPPAFTNPPVWLPAAKDAGLAAPLHPVATPTKSRRGATRHVDVRIFCLRMKESKPGQQLPFGPADD